MKILLIKPSNISDHVEPSLGLGYLATACRKAHDVSIIDCYKERLGLTKLLSKIKNSSPDAVAFQCCTFDLKFVKQVFDLCKHRRNEILTIIGGPHPSALPAQCFDYFGNSLDFVFIGEAEQGLPLLLDTLARGLPHAYNAIPGLCWKENKRLHSNPPVFIENLDILGMPAWDLIRPEEYPESPHGAFFKKFPVAPIIATRGCPFACTFCAATTVAGNKIRRHSVEFMMRQIRYLYDTHGIREFHIIDDNFTIDHAYAKKFLKSLIDLGLPISWTAPNGVRIDSLDEEMLTLMKKSGLYLLSIGIESGSDRILGLMQKKITTSMIRKTVTLINSYGIETAGFFMLGYPGETKEEIEKTIRFSRELGLLRANYFTFLPLPGSAVYQDLSQSRALDGLPLEKFQFMNITYVAKGLTKRGLKRLQRKAFLQFYLRPQIFFKNASQVQSLRHLWFLTKRFFHWIVKQ